MKNVNFLGDCFEILPTIKNDSVDLILTDPPYLISRESNFKKVSKHTPEDLKTKYNISIDFGEWDNTDLDWSLLFKEYSRILKKGGTLIMFWDIWKATTIKSLADSVKFKQSRIGAWIKTNPVPINSKLNYLSNATEYFFTFVKGSKPTFNSEYDKGFYSYPICHGKERLNHPTQKPLQLIKDLILKHSNEGEIVLDNFAGSFTTGQAAIETSRYFIGIEKDAMYFGLGEERLSKLNISQTIEYKNKN
jgi:site-specific DNA-methyltransferase (adenine-specific)